MCKVHFDANASIMDEKNFLALVDATVAPVLPSFAGLVTYTDAGFSWDEVLILFEAVGFRLHLILSLDLPLQIVFANLPLFLFSFKVICIWEKYQSLCFSEMQVKQDLHSILTKTT